MDFQKLAAQLIKARRGAKTQKETSKALGYQSNVVFAWENGRDEPSARAFFSLAALTGEVGDLSSFYRGNSCPNLTTSEGLSEFLKDLLASRTLAEVSGQMARDRHVVGRWVRGQTEIPLSSLLQFVDVTTLGLFDFLHAFVDPSALAEAENDYRLLEASRESARQLPWSNAIVHMVALPSYSRLKKHESGWFASRLDISVEEEKECLDLLVSLGQLRVKAGAYQSTRTINVDTRRDPQATRDLASFWMKEGASRVLTPGSGRFSFNTFAVSANDLEKAKALQSEYFRQLRELVADSEPAETVAVATFQLFALFEEPNTQK